MERISSGQTFFLKWIFPALWFGIIAIVFCGFAWSFFNGQPDPKGAPPVPVLIGPVIMLIFGFVLFRKLLWDLADTVEETRDGLLVRRGGVEQRIAYTDMLNVSLSQFSRPPRLSLRLRTAGPFGDEVTFIPKQPAFRLNPFQRNEIAERLIRRVDEARNTGVAKR